MSNITSSASTPDPGANMDGSVRAPKPHALAWSLGVALTQVAVASAAAPLPKYELHDIYVGIVACVGAVLVLCLCQAARTCQRERFTQAEVVVNYWLGCSVFAVAFLVGPVIVLVVGLSLLGSRQLAGIAMSGGGAALALIGLAFSGHSTTRLIRQSQEVQLIKRYFLVIPRTKVYPMRDVSGFTMRISQKRHRVVYQMQMLLRTQEVVPVEPGFTNVNVHKRQHVCSRLNQFLLDAHDDTMDSSASGGLLVPDPHQVEAGMRAADGASALGRAASSAGINAVAGMRNASFGADNDAVGYGAGMGGPRLERAASEASNRDPLARLLERQERARSNSGTMPPPGVAAALLPVEGIRDGAASESTWPGLGNGVDLHTSHASRHSRASRP